MRPLASVDTVREGGASSLSLRQGANPPPACLTSDRQRKMVDALGARLLDPITTFLGYRAGWALGGSQHSCFSPLTALAPHPRAHYASQEVG